MWSWLQMPLMGTGTLEIDFNNAETLNGLEVWRRLAVPSAPRSMARRYALRDKINNPKQCTSFADVLVYRVQWKKGLERLYRCWCRDAPGRRQTTLLAKDVAWEHELGDVGQGTCEPDIQGSRGLGTCSRRACSGLWPEESDKLA